MKMQEKTEVMDAEEIRRALIRISHEILEQNHGVKGLVLVGIKSRGDYLAKRISKNIEESESAKIPVGVIDTKLYRDDLDLFEEEPITNETDIPFEITDKKVVLVDEVLYTGRTIRAAMDALMDFGRPAGIQLAVLIDRGHREIPIAANYVGKTIPTSRKEFIQVHLVEEHGIDKATICEE
jgi:pyrimidine operon attenuation protein/uracil phosphoribosyltransferase